MPIRSYKDLDAWKHAVELAAIVDGFSDTLMRARRYAMADQIGRAALSVSSNIAEGNGRHHRAEYAHHVSMSRGSLYEVESILLVAIRTNRLCERECARAFALIEVLSRMLSNLLRALYRTGTRGEKPAGRSLATPGGTPVPSPQSLVPSP